MIIVVKNYPSLVDAKAWVVKCDRVKLIEDSKVAIEQSNAKGGELVLPSSLLHNPKQVVGVTFDDAENAVQQMYDFNWEAAVPYGDIILVGNRQEMLLIPDDFQVFLWMKNDRGNQLIEIFDFKKYMKVDPNRKSHVKGKTITNYCPPNVRPDKKDEATITTIAFMKEDRSLVEKDVLEEIASDPADNVFSDIL